MRKTLAATLIAGAGTLGAAAGPARVPLLPQIDLPHNYYYRELYLPQLTSGPSSAAWTPDGTTLIYSMQGSLWRQRVDSTVAEQLTDDRGTDYQPDCSPDGRSVAFVRYDGRSMELMLLDLSTHVVRPLTTGGAVNGETVSEQLLYEVGDPAAYLTPDVTADFTSLTLEQAGPDRVSLEGVQGKPATDSYKVSIAYRDGFVAGYREGGGELPADWLRLARMIDLISLCYFLERPEDDPAVLRDVRPLIETTLREFAP